jgi:agmatinase
VFGLTTTPQDAGVVLIPVPFEATTSYRGGTANGPRAVLEASRQVELFDLDTGHPWKAGIAMLDEPTEVRAWNEEARALAKPIIDAGGGGDAKVLEHVDALCAKMNAWVEATAERWLSQGKLVAVVGGDHSTPFGLIKALARRHRGVGILHLDAHADLREAYEGFHYSHASIMYNVLEEAPDVARIVSVGLRDLCEAEHERIRSSPERLRAFHDSELRRQLHDGESWSRLVNRIVAELPKTVYVSFDIDGLDPSLCPHTGTPVPGGLSFAEATALLRGVVDSGRRIVGFDLNEVAPDPEGRSEWDANVGARVLYKLIGFALLSQPE